MPAIQLPGSATPFSPGFRAGDFVFVSGQIASRDDGSVLIGDFTDEVNQTIDNVERILRAAGCGLEQVVKVNAWLSNPLLFRPFNEVYASRFPTPPPARTTVMVSFGLPDVRVEIDAVAYVGSDME